MRRGLFPEPEKAQRGTALLLLIMSLLLLDGFGSNASWRPHAVFLQRNLALSLMRGKLPASRMRPGRDAKLFL